MTAVLAIRVNDGVVLASEGRTLIRRNRDGEAVVAFDHAGKVFSLGSGPAAGFAACGAGSVGGLSMRFLAHEVSADEHGGGAAGMRVLLDRAASVISRHADDLACPAHNPRPDFTWLVGGYEPEALLPSLWRLDVRHGRPQAPERLERTLVWSGEGSRTIDRLIGGLAPEQEHLIRSEVTDVPLADHLVQQLGRLQMDLLHPEMPLGDAVGLAQLLLDTAIGIERLRGAVPSAGGQVCIAIIDRKNGFRYISGEPL